MKEKDWQLLRFIILWLVLILWLVFPFMEVSVNGENNIKILATNFSPLLLLHCYRQVASIFTFISDYSDKLLSLKCLRSIETKKLLVAIVVHKVKSLILRVTRRDVQLEDCIVPNVPISPQNPKVIWIIILPRNTTPQKLTSPSSVNFFMTSLKDFTLYVNIKTLNTECKSDREQKIWTWNN